MKKKEAFGLDPAEVRTEGWHYRDNPRASL